MLMALSGVSVLTHTPHVCVDLQCLLQAASLQEDAHHPPEGVAVWLHAAAAGGHPFVGCPCLVHHPEFAACLQARQLPSADTYIRCEPADFEGRSWGGDLLQPGHSASAGACADWHWGGCTVPHWQFGTAQDAQHTWSSAWQAPLITPELCEVTPP